MSPRRQITWLLVALFLILACSLSSPDLQETTPASEDAAATQTFGAALWATATSDRATEFRATDYAQMTATAEWATATALRATDYVQMTAEAGIPTPPPVPLSTAVTIWELHTVVNVAPDDVLNVRSEPGVSSPAVGSIPPSGQMVYITGPGREVDDAEWVPVTYKDVNGWVNRSFLAPQLGSVDDSLAAGANEIMYAIKNREFDLLSTYVHPDKGLRFTPYTYVRDVDLVFRPEQVSDLLTDPTEYLWGYFDGTGFDIRLSFQDYYLAFVYDEDYAQPQFVGFNEIIGRGNTINNIAEFYPDAQVVEYHFFGFEPRYAGMDWRSLRLILEQADGVWYLVGIVHDEWTI